MSVFARVLCPVDGSPQSLQALRTARDLASRHHSTLIVLKVLLPSSLALPELASDPGMEEARRALQRDIAAALGSDAAPLTSLIEIGMPAERIVAVARRERADLIVVGSRRPEGIERALLGSVASTVVHRAPCPVLVVPLEHETIRTPPA